MAGYSALVRGLNDELMVELMSKVSMDVDKISKYEMYISKDELGAKQDHMLDEISELTDSLL